MADREKVEEIDRMIAIQRAIISGAERARDNHAYYERKRAELVEKIENLQKHLGRLDEERNNAPALIENAKRRINELKKAKALELNADVAKLLKIQKELASMMGDD